MALENLNTNIGPSSSSGMAHTSVGQFGNVASENAYYTDLYKPIWDKMLIETYKQYQLTYIFDYIGATGVCESDTEYWPELPNIDRQQAIASTSINSPATTANITLTELDRFLIVGDEIKLPSGRHAVVIEIVTTSPQVIKVQCMDGTNFASSDFTDFSTDQIFYIANFAEPCYTNFESRHYAPNKKQAHAMYIPTTNDFCIDAASKPLFFEAGNGQQYWMALEQQKLAPRHLKQLEKKIVLGEATASQTYPSALPSGAPSSPGIVSQLATSSNSYSFGSAITEAELIEFTTALKVNAGADQEYALLGGAQFIADATSALKDYKIAAYAGGAFNQEASKGKFGLQLSTYYFNNIQLSFFDYMLFNEMAPTTSPINFRNAAMALNVSQNGNKAKYVELNYKRLYTGSGTAVDYMTRSLKVGHIPGQAMRSSNDRCYSEHMSSVVMLKMKALNVHGFLRSAA